MEAIAIHKNARTSAQKARLVANQVRGLPAAQAVYTLQFSPRKSAAIIFHRLWLTKVLHSSVSALVLKVVLTVSPSVPPTSPLLWQLRRKE